MSVEISLAIITWFMGKVYVRRWRKSLKGGSNREVVYVGVDRQNIRNKLGDFFTV